MWLHVAQAIKAVEHVKMAPADDYMVFLLSDAMLAQCAPLAYHLRPLPPPPLASVAEPYLRVARSRYRVTPQNLADALLSDPMVNSYVIFVAEEDTATQMAELMPTGRGHFCEDTTNLPLVLRQIFASSLARANM